MTERVPDGQSVVDAATLAAVGDGAVVVRRVRLGSTRDEMFGLDGPMIVTIDGPAGTGKSVVARRLAAALNLQFLDTGAMYRAATLVALQHGVPPSDSARLISLIRDAKIHVDWTGETPVIIAFDRPMPDEALRTPEINAQVSEYSAVGALREVMVTKQRNVATRHPRLVSEGRDQGSVVFPDAEVKFYLTASAEERARRRTEQMRAKLREQGRHGEAESIDISKVLEDIQHRDFIDANRPDGPLTTPEGAAVVNSTHLTEDEVVARMVEEVRAAAARQ